MIKTISIASILFIAMIALYSDFISKIESDARTKNEKLNVAGTCFSADKTKADSLGLRFVSNGKSVIEIESCK